MNRVQQKYSYISHPENLPLQLNGSSKKRVQSLKKEDYRQTRFNINEESRSMIMKKLSNSKYDLPQTKSVLPESDIRREKKASSIRTFNDDKQNIRASGIQYLEAKTVSAKPTQLKQRAHNYEHLAQPVKITNKKHFVSKQGEENKDEQKRPRPHRETGQTKLTKDIYSNAYRRETQPELAKKLDRNNLFKKGQDLGFEERRAKKCSDMKMIEMVGSQHVKKSLGGPREKRQDWRISNVNFF